MPPVITLNCGSLGLRHASIGTE
ncbi:hypothetical protein CGLO_18061 [Colletotrichum gloeosporioides Cg-14]|uniref:Uncharacterized protein n=1 Tax=Colletotrichum gloeosporioides (strain Cg-14) TaxID=1237896 RepID=T0JS36_COLGC|nr:hypothetical protein CGLO_18061 [Colletotrichum gloeosporioides Cg-14]